MVFEEFSMPVVLKKVHKKNSKLKNRTKPSKSNPILKQIDLISCLEAFQKTLVLAPITKASSKIDVICKRHYVGVILNKIGVIGHENNTYCKANKSFDEIINENTEYAKRLGFKTQKK